MFRHGILLIVACTLVELVAAPNALANPYNLPYGIQWNRVLQGSGISNAHDRGGEVDIAPDGTVWTGADGFDTTFNTPKYTNTSDGGTGNWDPLGNLHPKSKMATDTTPGNQDWISSAQSISQHAARTIVVDSSGNTFQAGFTRFQWTGQAPVTNNSEGYLMKRDSSNNLLWATKINSERVGGTDNWDIPRAVALDSNGDAWVAGYNRETLFPNGHTGNYTGSGDPDHDPFIFKVRSDGTIPEVGIQPHAPGNDRAYAIDVDKNNGNVAIAGWTETPGNTVGAPALFGNTYLGGSRDGWLGVYAPKVGDNTDMTLLFGKQIGGTDRDAMYSVAFDPSGNVVVAGYIGGGGTDNHQVYIAKYDTSGTLLGSDTFGGGGTSVDFALYDAIEIDADGNIYVTGRTNGSIGGPNSGGYDIFVRKYDNALTPGGVWTAQYGDTGDDLPSGMALLSGSPATKIYVNGSTRSSWLGENAATSTHDDYLLLKLVPGDFDGNGYVDQADIDYMAANLGTGNGLFDFDRNDVENDADMTYFLVNILDMEAPTAAATAPEPSALTIALLGLTTLGLRRRRRRAASRA